MINRYGEFIKKVITILAILSVLLIIGLIINNRIYYFIYKTANTEKDTLTDGEINAVQEVYSYLEQNGNRIFTGFNGNFDIIIYNDKYEFLFSSSNPGSEWTKVNESFDLNKCLYRRDAVNPQAFAIKVGDHWVGSFSTNNTYNKKVAETVPIYYPPQLLSLDQKFYRANIIHEMVHAYQGKLNSVRIDVDKNIHNVCSSFYSDPEFQKLIIMEAGYLEKAITTDNMSEIREFAKLFLDTRDKRRQECKMQNFDIHNEQEIEWLEGVARYAEYYASIGSSSPAASQFLDIDYKVKNKKDDRYYALGMAEVMVLNKLYPEWQDAVFKYAFTLEDLIRESLK